MSNNLHDNIVDYMTFDHRRVDEFYANAENFFNEGKEEEAKQELLKFDVEMRSHLAKEEDVLFPEFVNVTGMTHGPVQVMMMEHNQIKELLNQMMTAIKGGDLERALGVVETMHILVQQHNMKEEGILYPMIRQHCDIDLEAVKKHTVK